MASEFYVGVKIGAAVMGSFQAAFGSARSTLSGLGVATQVLSSRHGRMGDVMARAFAHPTRNVAALRQQYERLGQTLDTLRVKQERLTASLTKGEGLRQARVGMAGDMFATYATATAVAAPVVGAVKQATGFEAGLRDIAITGNLTRDEEVKLGSAIRQAALATSQGHGAIVQGVQTLVAQGMDAKEAGRYAGLLGKAATATNADMNDLAQMMFSLSSTLGIKGETNLKEALNRAAYGAKLGQFELKDMAGALPEMAAAFAAKGIKGQEALTQIVASLEVGRAAAGSGSEAVTNLRNWLSHMNSGHTSKQYQKAGVDYEKSMQNMVADGYSSYEASLMVANKFIASKGEAFSKAWAEAGKKGDEEAQRKLMESFGLNEVFQDIQTINHLLAMRQGWDKYKSNKSDMGGQQAQATIDEDYAKRAETAAKAFERFKTKVADLGITVGNALLPALTSALDAVTPWISRIGDFAAANPGVIRGIVGFATAVIGFKVAALAAGWALSFFVKSPLNALSTGLLSMGSKFALVKAIFMAGGSRIPLVLQLFGASAETAGKVALGIGKVAGVLRGFPGVLLTIGRAMLPFGQGLWMAVWSPLALIGKGAIALGGLLVGKLAIGLRVAGQAALWLGRALLMNPLGIAVAVIAGGAYLIYRNWDRLRPWFGQLWGKVRSVFDGAWSGIKTAFFTFHPLGILVKNWQPVMAWFRGLPALFAGFGRDVIAGLVKGISGMVGSAVDAVGSVATGIKDKFKSMLGIKSPSRVFLGFGDNIGQGAALGIGKSVQGVTAAVAGMAVATSVAWGKPQLTVPEVGAMRHQSVAAVIAPAPMLSTPAIPMLNGRDGAGGKPREELEQKVTQAKSALDKRDAMPLGGAAGAGGLVVHFAPQITVQGGDAAAVQQQVGQAMQLSFADFERMMKRYDSDRRRRTYGES